MRITTMIKSSPPAFGVVDGGLISIARSNLEFGIYADCVLLMSPSESPMAKTEMESGACEIC